MPVALAVLMALFVGVAGFMLGRDFGVRDKRQPRHLVAAQLWVLDSVGTVLVEKVMQNTCIYVVVEPMVEDWSFPRKQWFQVPIEDFIASGRLLEHPPGLEEVLQGIREGERTRAR